MHKWVHRVPEMGEKRSISVWILGQEYRIRSDAEEASVQKAASFVDETMTMIRERTGMVDSLNVAVLAALNISNHLISIRENYGDAGIFEPVPVDRLRGLVDFVESVAPTDDS